MAKATTVSDNIAAIENCRKHGITSIVSLIVGFPGETADSLEATYQFMQTARPDFHFIATFSVRVPGVPIL
jgi:tRNA A37 methylthiotransferase MiaB